MGVTRTAIHRPVTVFMFFLAVVLFGVVSLQRLSLNLLPDISYPSLTIQTDYEDAAPEEIESLITRPIEETVGVASDPKCPYERVYYFEPNRFPRKTWPSLTGKFLTNGQSEESGGSRAGPEREALGPCWP